MLRAEIDQPVSEIFGFETAGVKPGTNFS